MSIRFANRFKRLWEQFQNSTILTFFLFSSFSFFFVSVAAAKEEDGAAKPQRPEGATRYATHPYFFNFHKQKNWVFFQFSSKFPKSIFSLQKSCRKAKKMIFERFFQFSSKFPKSIFPFRKAAEKWFLGVFHLVTTVLSKAVGAFKVLALQRSSVALKGSKSFLGKLNPFKMCFGVKLLASYGNFEKLKTHFFSLSFRHYCSQSGSRGV